MKTSDELLQKFSNEAPLLTAESEKLFSGISEKQLNWKPSGDSWGIGECINHLVITHSLYYPQMNKAAIRNIGSWNGSPNFHHTFGAKMILRYVNPKEKRKSRTFKVFKPAKKYVTKDIFKSFRDEVEKMKSLAEKLSGADLTKLKISSPISPLIRMNLGDAFLINLYHDQRHLNQAIRVLNNKNFPI